MPEDIPHTAKFPRRVQVDAAEFVYQGSKRRISGWRFFPSVFRHTVPSTTISRFQCPKAKFWYRFDFVCSVFLHQCIIVMLHSRWFDSECLPRRLSSIHCAQTSTFQVFYKVVPAIHSSMPCAAAFRRSPHYSPHRACNIDWSIGQAWRSSSQYHNETPSGCRPCHLPI